MKDQSNEAVYQISMELLHDMEWKERVINISEIVFLKHTLKELATTIERLEVLLSTKE